MVFSFRSEAVLRKRQAREREREREREKDRERERERERKREREREGEREPESRKRWINFQPLVEAVYTSDNYCLAERIDFWRPLPMCSGSEEGSYLRLIDCFITQL